MDQNVLKALPTTRKRALVGQNRVEQEGVGVVVSNFNGPTSSKLTHGAVCRRTRSGVEG